MAASPSRNYQKGQKRVVMLKPDRTQERFIYRHRLWIRVSIAVCVLVFISILYTFLKPHAQLPRETLVLVGNPTVLWSWNKRDNSFVLIALPSDTVIDAVHGYGAYSLDALWKLGEIDKNERNLLRQSMQEFMGIPIPWYVGMKDHKTPVAAEDAKDIVRSYFLWQRLWSYVSGALHTNVPISVYFSFIKSFLLSTPDKISLYDMTELNGIQEEKLADGSSIKKLNLGRFDEIIGHAFDDEKLRNEQVSVAIYNTTDLSSVGQRIARLLGHMGIFVITVGNDTPEITDCTLTASKNVLRTKTAGFIRSLYHCKDLVDDGTVRADILLRMGSQYAETIRSKTVRLH